MCVLRTSALHLRKNNQNDRHLQLTKIKLGANVRVDDEFTRIKEFWLAKVNVEGGFTIGGKKYQVELVVLDNDSDISKAQQNQKSLIEEHRVLATIGPDESSLAIPTAALSNDLKTVMISAESTNPATTQNQSYVFRASVLKSFEGTMVAKFVSTRYGPTKAAIIYQCGDRDSEELANSFKEAWQQKYGEMVFYECIGIPDCSLQLDYESVSSIINRVAETSAEVLFLPTNELLSYSLIDTAKRNSKWINGVTSQESRIQNSLLGRLIIGGDHIFDTSYLFESCGVACEGVLAVETISSSEITKAFVADFGKLFNGTVVSDDEALMYDSFGLLKSAIERCGSVTGDLALDRECVRNSLSSTIGYPGISGDITFSGRGDPTKCVNFITVIKGKHVSIAQSCP